jgi:hypothetical protein
MFRAKFLKSPVTEGDVDKCRGFDSRHGCLIIALPKNSKPKRLERLGGSQLWAAEKPYTPLYFLTKKLTTISQCNFFSS